MMDKQFTLDELIAIVATLRSEHGCPWDRAQTHDTIRSTTLEEAYEVNQAVKDLEETRSPDNLIEELGDLLLQILLHCRIAEEKAEFSWEDVVDRVARKMIRRHPHVFGQKTYDSLEEQKKDWEALKAREHLGKDITPAEELDQIPRVFPALVRSQKAAKKSMKHGILPTDEQDIFREMLESVIALTMAAGHRGDTETLQKRLGNALFNITWLAARYDIPSEIALTDETDQLIRRIDASS